ncbi:MAG: 2-C-methyl-D-erythritol 4-phosphate cytidylyltransferase [Armatimonadetes bacterium]|nr:2-C-methyl-D-erythritol 4-phosphate cytidylyltransferase [Armatimonadota bacterium]NCQ29762.1 2-C-methyl-D-erythritol 4-phosphate cytidylyltransferase [Armatimonadota bacterium]
MATTTAIVPAAGKGERAGDRAGGKLFAPLLDRPLLAWTLQTLVACPEIDEIILVSRVDRLAKVEALVSDYGGAQVSRVVPGGEERLDSVLCGVRALSPDADYVVIHDGARPLCPEAVFARTFAAARAHGAAIAAIRATDTVKQATADDWIERTLERRHLWLAQTPQIFERSLFERACEAAHAGGVAATDDAALVERLGHPVRLVEGSRLNLKVTLPQDFAIAEALLRLRQAGGAAWSE